MKYKELGNTGEKVSAVGLGCMGMSMHYGVPDNEESMAVLSLALDLGINFLDTADMYVNGVTEEIVGKAIKGKRNQIVLASKGGMFENWGSNGESKRIQAPLTWQDRGLFIHGLAK